MQHTVNNNTYAHKQYIGSESIKMLKKNQIERSATKPNFPDSKIT